MSITRGLVLDVANQFGGVTPGVAILHDQSRYKNDGTFGVVAPTWTQLPTGQWALVFTRTPSAYITIGTHESLEIQQYTIEYWMNITTMHATATESNPYQKFVWVTSGYWAVYDGWIYKNCIEVPANREVAVDISPWVAEGEWHRYADRYDGADIKVFIDGVERASNTVGAVTIIHNPAIALTLGKSFNSIDGMESKFQMYNFARPAGQISNSFESERWLFGV